MRRGIYVHVRPLMRICASDMRKGGASHESWGRAGYYGLCMVRNHMQILIFTRSDEQAPGSGTAIEEPFSYTVFENRSLRGPTEEGTCGHDERATSKN